MLVGTATEILESVRAGNLAEDPARHFVIDPKAHIDARRDARNRGLTVIGFYHSHPRSEPEPSAEDLAEASYQGHLYLVVGPVTERYHARLFRLEHSRFVEVAFD